MEEVKLEIVRLLKYPVAGATLVFVIIILEIDVGNIKKAGMDGFEFYENKSITTKEEKSIAIGDNIEVQVPISSKDIVKTVQTSKYAKEESVVGWVYLGTYIDNSWNDRLIEISDYLLPEINKSYVVTANIINVRIGKPTFPFYGLKNQSGLAKEGDLIKIVALDSNLGRNRVWAKVKVYPKMISKGGGGIK